MVFMGRFRGSVLVVLSLAQTIKRWIDSLEHEPNDALVSIYDYVGKNEKWNIAVAASHKFIENESTTNMYKLTKIIFRSMESKFLHNFISAVKGILNMTGNLGIFKYFIILIIYCSSSAVISLGSKLQENILLYIKLKRILWNIALFYLLHTFPNYFQAPAKN